MKKTKQKKKKTKKKKKQQQQQKKKKKKTKKKKKQHLSYEEIKTKEDLSYISICSLSILHNSKFIL